MFKKIILGVATLPLIAGLVFSVTAAGYNDYLHAGGTITLKNNEQQNDIEMRVEGSDEWKKNYIDFLDVTLSNSSPQTVSTYIRNNAADPYANEQGSVFAIYKLKGVPPFSELVDQYGDIVNIKVYQVEAVNGSDRVVYNGTLSNLYSNPDSDVITVGYEGDSPIEVVFEVSLNDNVELPNEPVQLELNLEFYEVDPSSI